MCRYILLAFSSKPVKHKMLKDGDILQISKTLLELRTSSGKSQAEFAKLAGVSQRTWSSYETGQTTPKMGILWALAAKGYTIPGLTTPLRENIARLSGESPQKVDERIELAQKLAPSIDPEAPP